MIRLALHGTGPRNNREPTVTRHGPPRVIRRCRTEALFGQIDDEDVTQVDGVPVPIGKRWAASAGFAETTPNPIAALVFGGAR